MNHGGGLRQQEVCLVEEEIIDDFLSYWVNLDQLDDLKPCIFVADNCYVIMVFVEEKDVQSCEAVTSMEKNILEDNYSKEERKYEECFLNEESSNAFMFEAIKSMEEYLSEDKYSEAENNDEECPLNEGSNDAFVFEAIVEQEEIIVNKEEEIQSEALICEAIVETIDICNFQIENLCINAGIVN